MPKQSTIVGPDLTPDWFDKYARQMAELNRQLLQGLRNPGRGLCLDHVVALNAHQHPFVAQPLRRKLTQLEQIVADCQRALRRQFGRRHCPEVGPFPASVTEEVVARLARYNMRPVFLPDVEISEDIKLRDWIMPPAHFYQWMRDGKIAKDAATLRYGWYAADFTVGVDYTDGSQMMPNCPWGSLITRLRTEGKVGKHAETPAGSRFSIVPQGEWETVLTYMASTGELEFPRAQVRLERFVEFNAIGNLYDLNRGRFNMWVWLADPFEDSSRLIGGCRDYGGLANVVSYWRDDRSRDIAGRPLVSLG